MLSGKKEKQVMQWSRIQYRLQGGRTTVEGDYLIEAVGTMPVRDYRD